jgi:hypothetical protein
LSADGGGLLGGEPAIGIVQLQLAVVQREIRRQSGVRVRKVAPVVEHSIPGEELEQDRIGRILPDAGAQREQHLCRVKAGHAKIHDFHVARRQGAASGHAPLQNRA